LIVGPIISWKLQDLYKSIVILYKENFIRSINKMIHQNWLKNNCPALKKNPTEYIGAFLFENGQG
jgi:hypothetical protein